MGLQDLFLCEVLEQACNQRNSVQKAKLYLRCSSLIQTGIHTMMPFNKYMDLTWSYIYIYVLYVFLNHCSLLDIKN